MRVNDAVNGKAGFFSVLALGLGIYLSLVQLGVFPKVGEAVSKNEFHELRAVVMEIRDGLLSKGIIKPKKE